MMNHSFRLSQKTMRHAFLIIAHNEFKVLQALIDCLDSRDSDLFVHIDKKVDPVPCLTTRNSRLVVLDERIDVRWGNVSQIQTELLLLRSAQNEAFRSGKQYDYYHIISGTHLPLVSKERFDDYFRNRPLAVFLPMYTDEYEIDLKVRRMNICTGTFAHSSLAQLLWKASNRIQQLFGIKRFSDKSFYKASNWCSLSSDTVKYVLDRSTSITKQYRWSFCGDEFFLPSLLMNSDFKDSVEWRNDYLYLNFNHSANPKVLENSDYEEIVASGCLWARKFSSQYPSLLDMLTGGINRIV